MTYTITMTRTTFRETTAGLARVGHVPTRVKVATLNEARQAAKDALPATANLSRHYECEDIPESGGTIGPLPDGTIIKVTR